MQPAPVKIVTDSTSDLSQELLEQYKVEMIPLYTVLEDSSYRDRIDINSQELLNWCTHHKTTPKTSAASVGDFMEVFSKYVNAGFDVVYIGISSELSSTNQNARLAAQEFDGGRISVIDSRNLSTGIGYLVLEAAKMAGEGASAKDICQAIEAMIPKMNVSFVIDTLTFLYRGGRCSALQYLGANMLSLKPEIIVREGKMTTRKKYRGNVSKAVSKYVGDHLAEGNAIDPRRILVTYSPMDDMAVVEKVVEQVKATGYFKEVLTCTAGCVITSHCGGNTLGVIYMDK